MEPPEKGDGHVCGIRFRWRIRGWSGGWRTRREPCRAGEERLYFGMLEVQVERFEATVMSHANAHATGCLSAGAFVNRPKEVGLCRQL